MYNNVFKYVEGKFNNGKDRLSPPFNSRKKMFEYRAQKEGRDISEYKYHDVYFGMYDDILDDDNELIGGNKW